jgi:serine protease DegQ
MKMVHLTTKTSDGVAIAGVVRGGPAAEGGIKPNDVIVSVNGQKTKNDTELVKMIAGFKPDTTISVVVKRDKQEVELSVKVGKRPKVEQPEMGDEEQ